MYSSVRTATIFKTKKVHISKQQKEIGKLKMNVDCKAEALPENRIQKKPRTHTQQTRQKDVKLYKNSFFTFVQKVVSLLKGKLIFLLP